MEDGRCSKKYPKPLVADTVVHDTGNVNYRRRVDDRRIVVRRNNVDIPWDNAWIVPCNPYSLLKYRCHVNVEAYASAKSVKYLYKYFFKTPDQALVRIHQEGGQVQYNEVESY